MINNQPELSNKQTTLIVVWLYQILSVILALGWLLVCLLPVAMSFDSGYQVKIILFDIAFTFAPIMVLGLTNWFCWYNYRKARYTVAFSVMIVMVVIIAIGVIGALKIL